MRNQNHHHQQLYYQHKKTMFLPILCSRPTIKDVSLPRSIASNSSCNDPLSPRIGCMGQVKRNNKIAGFPTSSHNNYNKLITAPTTISPLVKYSKLKSFFSSKNLTNTTTPSTTKSTTNFSSCRTKQRVSRNQRCNKNESINIEGMDPPLPVIKKVCKLEEGECLWKRRSGGPTIKSLQLQQIQHLNMSPQPTTV